MLAEQDAGHLAVFGAEFPEAPDEPCQLGAHHTIFKGITLTGFWLQKTLTSMPRPELEALYADLAGRVASGALRVEVEATYPIEEIKAALAHAAREGRGGKVLVTPNGPV